MSIQKKKIWACCISPYKQEEQWDKAYMRREPQLQKKSKIEAHENPNSCGFFKALMCNDQNVSHVPNTETTSPPRIPESDLSRGLALAPVSTSQLLGTKKILYRNWYFKTMRGYKCKMKFKFHLSDVIFFTLSINKKINIKK